MDPVVIPFSENSCFLISCLFTQQILITFCALFLLPLALSATQNTRTVSAQEVVAKSWQKQIFSFPQAPWHSFLQYVLNGQNGKLT